MASKKKTPSGATRSGFHFIEKFKNCKRFWYLENILGITPAKKPHMLVFGGAFHAGKANFYQSGSVDAAVTAFRAALREELPLIEDPEKYADFMLARGPIMLNRWADTFGRNDLATYKVLAVEKVFEVKLPNGFTITVKPDAVLQASNGAIYIFETKTSFFSANLQEDVVALGDQATTYLYAWRSAHPEKPAAGVVPDIIYWNRNTNKSENIELRRGNLVTRTAYELWSYEQGVMSDLLDMAGRVRGLSGAHPAAPEALFPRTTSQCIAFNRRCEFSDICRERLEEGGPLPGGFQRDVWKQRKALLGVTAIPKVPAPRSKKGKGK